MDNSHEQPLFIIKNLSCAYNGGKEVIRVHNIDIPRNQLVVLLGISGSGKSTFLETLGLMNKTIADGDVIFIPGQNDKEGTSFADLWKTNNYNELSRIRKTFFSFIFQNNNLMPNFTAHENASLTQMIQGKSFEGLTKVSETMVSMGLIKIGKNITAAELSGGQKQRLAFVRAVTPKFMVLFGDEPTGNLDEFNAIELMRKLKESLSDSRSAIVVSHNIQMSLYFADTIILIEKTNKNVTYCEIGPHCIYKSDPTTRVWKNHKGAEIGDEITRSLENSYKILSTNN